jgi:hypothetical protein
MSHLTAMNSQLDMLRGAAKFIDKFLTSLRKDHVAAAAVTDGESDNSFKLLDLAAEAGCPRRNLVAARVKLSSSAKARIASMCLVSTGTGIAHSWLGDEPRLANCMCC